MESLTNTSSKLMSVYDKWKESQLFRSLHDCELRPRTVTGKTNFMHQTRASRQELILSVYSLLTLTELKNSVTFA